MPLTAGTFPDRYNVPFFPEVWTRAGYGIMYDKFGDHYSHDLSPRAKVFRRDHAKVLDRESFKTLMRYNDWRHDPFSLGS